MEAEQGRTLAEQGRREAEDNRKEAEDNRKEAEDNRKETENKVSQLERGFRLLYLRQHGLQLHELHEAFTDSSKTTKRKVSPVTSFLFSSNQIPNVSFPLSRRRQGRKCLIQNQVKLLVVRV